MHHQHRLNKIKLKNTLIGVFFFNIYFMANSTRIQIDKIYTNINRIAMLGKNYEMDFKNYIDDLIRNSQYGLLQDCLEIYYNIDSKNYDNTNILKYKVWPIILGKTKSPFINMLSILYKKNDVFQQGNTIYSNTTGFIIGTINEIDIQSFLSNSVYYTSVQYDYYYENPQFQDFLNLNRTFLEVCKVNSTDIQTITFDDPNNSEETNLYQRYVLAIQYLLS